MTIAVISMIRDAWGGSEELWYEMAKIALKKEHRVIHIAYETSIKHAKIKELEILGLKQYKRPGWIPPNSSALKKYAYLGWNFLRKKINSPIKKLFRQKPDIVIYNGTCYSIAFEKELLKQMRDSNTRFFIIGHLNNDLIRGINDKESERIRKAYALSKKVFFVSIKNLETAKRQLCTDILNAEIIKNPVNLSSVELISFPSMETTIQLACIGNLVTIHKGQDIVIQALSKWENKNWMLNLYGSGSDLNYLKHLVRYLKLEKKIIFHGTVTKVKTIWEQNHVLLMGSHMEGMPLVVVEAMLCGRVCIVPNIGGNSEWITNGKNGFIAEASTVHSLLNTIVEAYSLKDKWVELGIEAHKTAMQIYDPHAGTTLFNHIIAE